MTDSVREIKFIDLCCGIGGFRFAAAAVFGQRGIASRCVFSCDNDPYAQLAYQANFGEKPFGDIAQMDAHAIPGHDLLFAGFPCQPFSIIGNGHGFDDARGTLFFEIARILEAKKPRAFVLENVKRLVGHNKGHTLKRILETLKGLGYYVDYKVLNALDFGLPQKRERVFLAGFREPMRFPWPEGTPHRLTLADVLEKDVDEKFYASAKIREKRRRSHKSETVPSIWHENKSGNVSSYPYSCALRAGASYNYLLVDGERRLTPREMLRLQGFPDSFKLACPDGQTRKQAGNAVPVNVVAAILEKLVPILLKEQNRTEPNPALKKAG
ncbi:MAG: DNA (cytosine-5-)-methyltransferase [Nitrospinae bacterium]|nr:DNA (cytosine-5-)-methyltransferase [Nitrospinota bacterium]